MPTQAKNLLPALVVAVLGSGSAWVAAASWSRDDAVMRDRVTRLAAELEETQAQQEQDHEALTKIQVDIGYIRHGMDRLLNK